MSYLLRVAIGGWVLAALLAGVLGWLGRPIMVLLPESADAAPQAPDPITIARAPNLCWWLAGVAIGLITLLDFAIEDFLLPGWIVVCGIGTWLAYIDWRTRILPTVIVWPLFGVTAVTVLLEGWLTGDWSIFLRAAGGSAVAFGSFWALWWIVEQRKPGSFGFGDVRFAPSLGLVLGSVGVWAVPVGLYLGFAIGAVTTWVLRPRGQDGGIAFGPAMLAGAVLGALLCG